MGKRIRTDLFTDPWNPDTYYSFVSGSDQGTPGQTIEHLLVKTESLHFSELNFGRE